MARIRGMLDIFNFSGLALDIRGVDSLLSDSEVAEADAEYHMFSAADECLEHALRDLRAATAMLRNTEAGREQLACSSPSSPNIRSPPDSLGMRDVNYQARVVGNQGADEEVKSPRFRQTLLNTNSQIHHYVRLNLYSRQSSQQTIVHNHSTLKPSVHY
jgi:hypothetical protein